MSKWLLSIIGVVFLGVMLDIVYPNGRTNVFCKSIFGIFIVFVLISPLIKLKENYNNINYIDSTFLNSIYEVQEKNLILQIENVLNNMGIEGVVVEIDSNLNNNEFEIENVYVDISNIVLSENLKNINKYEVITNKIKNITKIESSRIIIYG